MKQDFYKFLDLMLKRKAGNLREIVEKRGWTVPEFCKFIGTDTSNFYKMDAGLYRGSVSYWQKVWKGLQ